MQKQPGQISKLIWTENKHTDLEKDPFRGVYVHSKGHVILHLLLRKTISESPDALYLVVKLGELRFRLLGPA